MYDRWNRKRRRVFLVRRDYVFAEKPLVFRVNFSRDYFEMFCFSRTVCERLQRVKVFVKKRKSAREKRRTKQFGRHGVFKELICSASLVLINRLQRLVPRSIILGLTSIHHSTSSYSFSASRVQISIVTTYAVPLCRGRYKSPCSNSLKLGITLNTKVDENNLIKTFDSIMKNWKVNRKY